MKVLNNLVRYIDGRRAIPTLLKRRVTKKFATKVLFVDYVETQYVLSKHSIPTLSVKLRSQ